MAKINLTNRFTTTATCKGDKPKEVYYDTELSGFQLEVRNTGNKTFYYSYSIDTKRTMQKLGNADTMTADEARHLALKMRKAIATDSLESMFTKKSKTLTLIKFYEEYYLPHIKVHSNSWDKNESTYRVHILPMLGSYPMDEITSPMISKLHIEMVTTKKLSNSTANKLLVFLRHAYNLAIEMK
ncbi:MAG: integrase arm-type DNA-binding domain-containing protein, partial [Campylobacterales bacterium]|nr:integrase arm-type DNA-binding domain-containing protein [Campylobacterales bacterium]